MPDDPTTPLAAAQVRRIAEIIEATGDMTLLNAFLADQHSRAAPVDAGPATEPEGLREAAQAYLDAEAEPAYSWVEEGQRERAGYPNREKERMDRIDAARKALRAALTASEPGLDAAWREAEAALPEDRGLWLVEGVQLVDTSDSDDLDDEQLEWEAEAVDHQRGGQPRNVTALGTTPAAALRALAARLRSTGPDR